MTKAQSPKWLNNFVDNYEKLSVDNLHLLQKIYHQDIEFQDPAHALAGFDNLQEYFSSLYTNLKECNFVIDKVLLDGDEAAIYWQMQYRHPKLGRGELICVEGSSLIRGQDDKVIQHRDYVDFGAMLYEHIPGLGHAVKFIKKRLSN